MSARLSLLRDLQAQIARLETAARNPARIESVSTGFAALDGLFPGGGLAGGTLVEWLGAGGGNGGMTLALAVGGRIVTATGGTLAIIGEGETLFPPAAAGLGVPLDRTLVVRPRDRRTLAWVWEQSLRCEAVGVTVGRMEQVSEGVRRRLQLAVETGGGLGFLVRSADPRTETAWAEARLLVKALPGEAPDAWRMRVELLKVRGGFGGAVAEFNVGQPF